MVKLDEIATDNQVKSQCQRNRERLLSECTFLTQWIVDFFNEIANSKE
jgi:hypothetical protein